MNHFKPTNIQNTTLRFIASFLIGIGAMGCFNQIRLNDKTCPHCIVLPFSCDDVSLVTSKQWKHDWPIITITQDSIFISEERIISLDNGEVRQEDTKGYLLPSLYDPLLKIPTDSISSSREINILAASSIPWSTLRHVMYTSGQARFDQFNLLGTSKKECLDANSWRQNHLVPMYGVDLELPLMTAYPDDPVEFLHPARIKIMEDHLELYPPYIERQDLVEGEVFDQDLDSSSNQSGAEKESKISKAEDSSAADSFAAISIPCTDGCKTFDTHLLREHLVRLEQTELPIKRTQAGSSPLFGKHSHISHLIISAHQETTVQTLMTVIDTSKIESNSDAFRRVFISGEL